MLAGRRTTAPTRRFVVDGEDGEVGWMVVLVVMAGERVCT